MEAALNHPFNENFPYKLSVLRMASSMFGIVWRVPELRYPFLKGSWQAIFQATDDWNNVTQHYVT